MDSVGPKNSSQVNSESNKRKTQQKPSQENQKTARAASQARSKRPNNPNAKKRITRPVNPESTAKGRRRTAKVASHPLGLTAKANPTKGRSPLDRSRTSRAKQSEENVEKTPRKRQTKRAPNPLGFTAKENPTRG